MKVAFVPPEPDVERDEALRIAARWAAQECGGRPDQVVLIVPVRNSVEHSDVLAAMAKTYRWETTQTIRNARAAGKIVIAVWASEEMIEKIAERRPSAICVVQWRAEETDDWLSAHGATDLTGMAPPGKSATIADPVPRVAWEDAARFINPNNRLYQSEDRASAVETLRLLQKHGHKIDPDELFRWAIARRWPEEGARNLRKLAEEVLAGKRHRVSTLRTYNDAVYQRWKSEAEARA